MNAIISGNRRFQESSHPKHNAEKRLELTKGQKPEAVVVSCSDSRFVPEIFMDQGLGNLFTVRTAGHVLGSNSIASIEYAIQKLFAKVIIVMGHEQCGAVGQTVRSSPDSLSGSVHMDNMMSKIRTHISKVNLAEDLTHEKSVKANIEGTIREMLEDSKIIRDSVRSKQVKIVPAYAKLHPGEIEFLEFNLPEN